MNKPVQETLTSVLPLYFPSLSNYSLLGRYSNFPVELRTTTSKEQNLREFKLIKIIYFPV